MKAILIAVIAGLCWGVGESFTKSVLHTGKIGPVTAMAARTTVALPVLWLAAWFVMTRLNHEPRGWIGELGWSTGLKLALGSGLMAGAAGMLLFYVALNMGTLSTVKPVAFATAVVTAVILGWLVFRDPMPMRKALAAVLIGSGILLMIDPGPAPASAGSPSETSTAPSPAADGAPVDEPRRPR